MTGRKSDVGQAGWIVDDIPFDAINPVLVRDRTDFFYVIASASFIEITSDLYTRNLIEFYGDNDELTGWLADCWQQEEIQHGVALKRYVQAAWPDFDWDRAYRGFLNEYGALCKVESLAESRSLEMVARCVVETGTASFYRTLSETAPEPVLQQMAARISADEVRHYKNFYRYFRHYRDREQPSRLEILRQLWRRGTVVKAEDAYIAFKHAYLVRNVGACFTDAEYRKFRAAFRRIAKTAVPYGTAAKMILKPLDLSVSTARIVQPTLELATRLIFAR